MEAKNRSGLSGSVPTRALNISGDIRDQNPRIKVESFGAMLIQMNQARPRSALAIQQPNIGGDIESSTQSLD